jgi:putative colanic acid biosynthesis acetyltransferase WcaF
MTRTGSPPDIRMTRLRSAEIAVNRAARKYSTAEQARRVLWSAAQWLLRYSPRPAFAWRRFVLRAFGARIGRQVHVYPSTRIYMPWNLEVGDWSAIGEDAFIYNLGPVTLGESVTLSYRCHVCAGTHDLRDPLLPLLKPPVRIESGAWVGTDAFIGPGVTVGSDAVVGARAVVVRSVPARTVVAGNPARPIGMRDMKAR